MPSTLDRLYGDLAEVEAGRRQAVETAHGLVAEWDQALERLEGERDAAIEAGNMPEYRRASRDMAHAIRMRRLASTEWDASEPDDPYHPDWSADVSANEHRHGDGHQDERHGDSQRGDAGDDQP